MWHWKHRHLYTNASPYGTERNARHKHSLAAKVKEDIEEQETDKDIFTDIYMSSANAIRGLIYRW